MKHINHHIENSMLAEYADGRLDYATSLVVAAHVSLCNTCRAEMETFDALSGAMFQSVKTIAPTAKLENDILKAIHTSPATSRQKPVGPYPQPVMDALDGQEPKWKSLGPGIKQHIISRDKKSSVRLLRIEAGKPAPEHSHHGQELTLVLQGAFGDKTGEFHVGDVEIVDGDLEHQPIAMQGQTCICLASTSDNLIFKSILPRVFQPIFRI